MMTKKTLFSKSSMTLAVLAALLVAPNVNADVKGSTQNVGKHMSLHYLRTGHGEAVLLVHGFAETAKMWTPFIPILAKNYTVIAPDLPGLGGSSPMPGGRYDMKSVAQYLHQLVRRLGFKKVRLVGHDIGLMAVYAYGAQYPQEVEKLVMMDAPIPGIGDEWEKIYTNPALWHFHFANSPIALKLVKGRERTFLDHFWISFSANPNKIALSETERRNFAAAYAKPGAMAAGLGYFRAFPRDANDNSRFLKRGKLTMPVLVIAGEKSMGEALGSQARQTAVNVKSVVLKNAGHWILEERPKDVESAIVRFLGSPSAMNRVRPIRQRLTQKEIGLIRGIGAGIGSSGVSGIQTRVLKGDPNKSGLYTIQLEVPAHTRIQAHVHPDDRVATVVSGTWYFGYGPRFDPNKLKALPPGSFYTEPANQVHFARTGDTAVLVQISGVGPTGTQYVVTEGKD